MEEFFLRGGDERLEVGKFDRLPDFVVGVNVERIQVHSERPAEQDGILVKKNYETFNRFWKLQKARYLSKSAAFVVLNKN